jgi:hypothetical protein
MKTLKTVHNLIPILAACALAYTAPASANCTVELHGQGSNGKWQTMSIKENETPLGFSDEFVGGDWIDNLARSVGRDFGAYSRGGGSVTNGMTK